MTRLVATLSLLLAGVGCTTDNFAVVLLKNVVPDEGSCIVPADAEAVGRSRGTLDVTNPLPNGALNPGYIFTPVVTNDTLGNTSTNTNIGNPNSHIFFVRGANIELTAGVSSNSQQIIAALAARNLTRRSQRFSTSIPPNGISGLSFSIIDDEQVASLGEVLGDQITQIVARITVFGLIDDRDVETPVFEYPITLCRGCHLTDAGDCAALSYGTVLESKGCAVMQDDGEMPCCTISGGGALCPARSTAPKPATP